jgi:hypothetical protein
MSEHDLDYGAIDKLDGIRGDEQNTLVWCRTHERYEWHWLPRKVIEGDAE